jgi:hypothetical protein
MREWRGKGEGEGDPTEAGRRKAVSNHLINEMLGFAPS